MEDFFNLVGQSDAAEDALQSDLDLDLDLSLSAESEPDSPVSPSINDDRSGDNSSVSVGIAPAVNARAAEVEGRMVRPPSNLNRASHDLASPILPLTSITNDGGKDESSRVFSKRHSDSGSGPASPLSGNGLPVGDLHLPSVLLSLQPGDKPKASAIVDQTLPLSEPGNLPPRSLGSMLGEIAVSSGLGAERGKTGSRVDSGSLASEAPSESNMSDRLPQVKGDVRNSDFPGRVDSQSAGALTLSLGKVFHSALGESEIDSPLPQSLRSTGALENPVGEGLSFSSHGTKTAHVPVLAAGSIGDMLSSLPKSLGQRLQGLSVNDDSKTALRGDTSPGQTGDDDGTLASVLRRTMLQGLRHDGALVGPALDTGSGAEQARKGAAPLLELNVFLPRVQENVKEFVPEQAPGSRSERHATGGLGNELGKVFDAFKLRLEGLTGDNPNSNHPESADNSSRPTKARALSETHDSSITPSGLLGNALSGLKGSVEKAELPPGPGLNRTVPQLETAGGQRLADTLGSSVALQAKAISEILNGRPPLVVPTPHLENVSSGRTDTVVPSVNNTIGAGIGGLLKSASLPVLHRESADSPVSPPVSANGFPSRLLTSELGKVLSSMAADASAVKDSATNRPSAGGQDQSAKPVFHSSEVRAATQKATLTDIVANAPQDRSSSDSSKAIATTAIESAFFSRSSRPSAIATLTAFANAAKASDAVLDAPPKANRDSGREPPLARSSFKSFTSALSLNENPLPLSRAQRLGSNIATEATARRFDCNVTVKELRAPIVRNVSSHASSLRTGLPDAIPAGFHTATRAFGLPACGTAISINLCDSVVVSNRDGIVISNSQSSASIGKSSHVEVAAAVKTDSGNQIMSVSASSGASANGARIETTGTVGGAKVEAVTLGTAKTDVGNLIPQRGEVVTTNSSKGDLPLSPAAKNDAALGGKNDANSSRLPEGKGPAPESAVGTARGTTLTPQIVNGLVDSIRFGSPLPEGLTFHNGEIAVRYGDEVLYFPGLRAALKFAQVVGLIDSSLDELENEEEPTPKPAPWATETRVKYTVVENDTLNTIAASQLGDARLADLILTINRSEILHRLEGSQKVPFVYPGQILWLPSEVELNIYKKNFFSKNVARSIKISKNAAVTADDGSASSKKILHNEYIAHNARQMQDKPRTTVRDLPQIQINDQKAIEHLVNMASACGVDLEAKTVFSKKSQSGSCQAEPLFLHASTDDSCKSDTVVVSPTVKTEVERLVDLKRLAADARIIVSELASKPGCCLVKLEMLVGDDWMNIAAYDCGIQSTCRIRNGKNGAKATMMIHLPAQIARTMAMEDFSRNWLQYRTNFEANKVKNSQVDSVPPTPVDFTRIGIRHSVQGAASGISPER